MRWRERDGGGVEGTGVKGGREGRGRYGTEHPRNSGKRDDRKDINRKIKGETEEGRA